jgi:hypothetical protein
MANESFEIDTGNGRMVVGPETKVFLYFGEGMAQYDHAVIERPDLRDIYTDPELPNPNLYTFNKNMIRFLGGLAIPDDQLKDNKVLEIAGSMKEQVGHNVDVIILESPDDYVKQKYFDQIINVAQKALSGRVGVPEEWVETQNASGELVEEEKLTPDEILMDYEVSQIGRRVLYGYFPKEWAERERANSRNREIFGPQLHWRK